MTTERVNVHVLLLFGDQAGLVGHASPGASTEPRRYPATEIASAIGVEIDDLPGAWLTAEVGDHGRLLGWQFA
ncbi:hypothetical protein [Streptomyces sp. NPDC047009]|uniref:hypothetical protein n=1 Tax=Streptomyces sp. NPDC047009 TaxID=3154496 RepID=UPI0033C3A710